MDPPRRLRGGYDDEDEDHANDDEGEGEEDDVEGEDASEDEGDLDDDDADDAEDFDGGDEFDDDEEDEDDDDDEENLHDGDDESYAILTAAGLTAEIRSSLPSVEVDLTWIASVEQFTDREVGQVARALKEEEGVVAGAVKDISIQLRHSRHTMAVAKRTTKILLAMGVADALESLTIEYEDDGETSRAAKFMIFDHYLSSLSNSPRGASGVSSRLPLQVHLECLCYDPRVWATFVNRFPNIHSLSLGSPLLYLHNFNQRSVAAVADTFHGLSELRSVTANINVRGTSHTEAVARLFRGLSAAPQLESLCVQFDDDEDDEVGDDQDFDDSDGERDTTELVDSVNHLARLIATARSLKKFRFQINGNAEQAGVDCIALLEEAVGSTALEEMELVNVHIRRSALRARDNATNQSLRELTLSQCFLFPEFWSPLPRFENLRSVRINDPRTSQHRASWLELFRRLPNLESFTDANRDDHRIDHDQELAAIADNLDAMPLLRNVVLATNASPYRGRSVEFPSLEVLVRKCKGTLDLDHAGCGDDNVRFVCAGLNSALYLTHLHLSVTGLVMTPASVAAVIACLETNKTLQTFQGIFEVSSPAERGTIDPVLTSMLSVNKVLKEFALYVHLRMGVRDSSDLGHENMLLEAIVAGLVHNETLKSLSVAPFKVNTSFRDMLQKNTTLQFVSDEGDPEITWLLTLNRYKRRLLLAPQQLPESLWTRVLEQIVKDDRADVLFHFVKRLPSSIVDCIRSRVK